MSNKVNEMNPGKTILKAPPAPFWVFFKGGLFYWGQLHYIDGWFALFEVWMKPFSVALAKLDTVPFWCINWPHNGEGTINVDYFQTSKQTWTFGDFKKISHQGNFLSRFSRESSLKFQLNEKLLRKAFCSCSSKTKMEQKTRVDLHSRNDDIIAKKKQSNGELKWSQQLFQQIDWRKTGYFPELVFCGVCVNDLWFHSG